MIDDHVLRPGTTRDSLEIWLDGHRARESVEAVINHLHMSDLHRNDEAPATELQLRRLGRVLKQIYETKLKADFPERTFVVSFPDEPDLDWVDYAVTFWEVRR